MNNYQLTKLKEVIESKEKEYSFNDYVWNFVDEKALKELDSKNDVLEYIEELNEDYSLTDAEVIYYATAMEHLSEYDQSLRESLEIAHEMGYETDSLNSELLASLLKSRNNQEDFSAFLEDVENDIDGLFN